ncbi:hypothetical protein D9619_002443 [Psilocybe cf. subviscida]|uniref:Uncharacterized protein n=1 Tax=Psilocybe cf. subviscida TaxID=2480587 RepID=A0A8H5EUC3_9AGAR|nr:hypothetical protein D9619_002443 [Psilocybe cf. subviscida]
MASTRVLSYTTARTVGARQSSSRVKFPAGTTGVFYYKQSVIAPSHIGELRFRQCPDVLSFDNGKDLCLPSGEIWHISSNRIQLSGIFESLKKALSSESLLDRDLHPGYTLSNFKKLSPALSSLSLPFPVDLSTTHLSIDLVGRDMTIHQPSSRFSCQYLHGQKNTKPLYQGRAVVRFEPYPPTPHNGKYKHQPLLALRILELLTPVTRLTDDEYMMPPVPGELLTVDYRGKGHVPWAFRTSKPSIEKAIMELLPHLAT